MRILKILFPSMFPNKETEAIIKKAMEQVYDAAYKKGYEQGYADRAEEEI